DLEADGAHFDALDRGRPGVAAVVPHEVESLETAHGVPHDSARIIVLRQIRRDAVSDATGGGDLAHDALHSGAVHVDHGDLRALAHETQRACAAHTRNRGGHDPDLPGHTHRQPSDGD